MSCVAPFAAGIADTTAAEAEPAAIVTRALRLVVIVLNIVRLLVPCRLLKKAPKRSRRTSVRGLPGCPNPLPYATPPRNWDFMTHASACCGGLSSPGIGSLVNAGKTLATNRQFEALSRSQR